MSTKIRPEVSRNNEYWIERHRYYELKHFCLQYPIWKKIYISLDGLSSHFISDPLIKTNEPGNPTEKCVMERNYYFDRMNLVEQAATEADPMLADYILKGVTEGVSYEFLKLRYSIPCCKDTYYKVYRRFFWLLSKARE